MTLAIFGATVVLPWLAGEAILAAVGVGRRHSGWARPAWALLAGGIVFSVCVAAALSAGVPRPERAAFVGVVAIGVAAGVRAWRRRVSPGAPSPDAPSPDESRVFPRWERVFFGLALLVAVAAPVDRALLARAVPVASGDELMIWDAKARAFADDAPGRAPLAARLRRSVEAPGAPLPVLHHPDYPALLPLWASAAHRMAGGAAEEDVRLPAQALSVALAFALAGALRWRVRPGVAALLLLAAGSRSSFFDALFMADTAVALGILVAADALGRSHTSPRPGLEFVAGVGAVFAAGVKNEGSLLVGALGIGVVLAGLAARPMRHPLWRPVAAGLAVTVATFAWNASVGLKNDLVAAYGAEGIVAKSMRLASERGVELGALLARDVLMNLNGTAGLFLVAFGAALIARRRSPEALFLAAAVFVPFVGFALIFLTTYHSLADHWSTAGERVFSQLLPLAALWSASSTAALAPWAARRTNCDLPT